MSSECVEVTKAAPGAKSVGVFFEEPGRSSGPGAPLQETRAASHSRWARMKSLCGRVILLVCPQGRKECQSLHCRLQPFCACARLDHAAAIQVESRIWITLGALSFLIIAVALALAIFQRR